MTLAPLLAGVAGRCAVGAAWDALVLAERARVPALVRRALARVLAAGRGGREPTERRSAGASPRSARWRCSRRAGCSPGRAAGLALAAGGPAVAAAAAARPPPALARRARARRARRRARAGRRADRRALRPRRDRRGGARRAACPAPPARSWRAAPSELALGERTDDRARAARARAPACAAYDTLVAAILLQRDAGGDLAGLLRGVARSLEEQRAGRRRRPHRHRAGALHRAAWSTALPVGAAGARRARAARLPAVAARRADPGAARRRWRSCCRSPRSCWSAGSAGCARDGRPAPRSPARCWPSRSPSWRRRGAAPGGRAGGHGARARRACSRRSGGAPALRLQPGDVAARLAAAGAPPGIGVADVLALKAGAARRRRAARRCRWRPRRPAGSPRVVLVAAPAGGVPRARRRAGPARAAPRGARWPARSPTCSTCCASRVQAGLDAGRALGEVGRRRGGLLGGELRRTARRARARGPARARRSRGSRRAARCRRSPRSTAAIGRADRHGAPLAPALEGLAAEARAEHARRLRDEAARAAPKIQLVVALLLVPAVMLLVAAALVQALVPAA